MRKLALTIIIGAGTFVLGASPVRAQGSLDHLLCYRTHDPLQLKTAVDMIAELQPEFSQKRCTLIKPVEFCVPASKENVQPPAANPSIVGQPLQNDYVCYLAQCQDQASPPDKLVADQFGERAETNFRPIRICVPARKRPLTCGLTGDGMCGGACPRPGDQCRADGSSGQCACKPTRCHGDADEHGACGGACRDPNDRCLPNADNECTCQPPPPPPCGLNPAAGICGGSCANPTDQCAKDATGNCSCQPPPATPTPTPATTPCTCGSTCVGANGAIGQCQPAAGSTQCECVAPQPCGLDPASNTCGGGCSAANQVCMACTGAACPAPCMCR